MKTEKRVGQNVHEQEEKVNNTTDLEREAESVSVHYSGKYTQSVLNIPSESKHSTVILD